VSAHTPGPWVFEQVRTKDGTSYHHIRAGSAGVANTHHSDPITVLGWGPLSGHLDARHGNTADARLIAAAPDMLAALTRVRDALSDREWWVDMVLDEAGVDAAIAKARGE
jgi:hypothetical protein